MPIFQQGAEPLFRLIYKGVDISSELAPHLVACTYTDKLDNEADEIEVEVQDRDGLWRGAWCPEHGDICSLSIGYKGQALVPCGDFEIDEPNARLGRSGDGFTFRGLSAPVSKSLRTAKTRGYEKQSLKQIAQKIAGEHGLTIVGTPPDVTFDRVTQRRERDLQFLGRLASEYGAYFTVKGKQLIFAKRDEVHGRASVMTIRAAYPFLDPGSSGDYVTADLKKASKDTYSKAKATYFDGHEKKEITVEVADTKVTNGDTHRIDGRVENEGNAHKRAKSELQKKNLKKQTGSIALVGNPYLVAGQTIQLDGGFGKWAGKYVIQSARHRIDRSGYTTAIEIAAV